MRKFIAAIAAILLALSIAGAPAAVAKSSNPATFKVCAKAPYSAAAKIDRCQVLPRYRERVFIENPFTPKPV